MFHGLLDIGSVGSYPRKSVYPDIFLADGFPNGFAADAENSTCVPVPQLLYIHIASATVSLIHPADAVVPNLSYSQYSNELGSPFVVYGTEWNNMFPTIGTAYCPYTLPNKALHLYLLYYLKMSLKLLNLKHNSKYFKF